MIQPINQLAIGSIAKIPSLPNINNVTVLHINFSGVRVKGSETLKDKTTFFDHIVSGQTPVEKIGFDENVAKQHAEKEALREGIILQKAEKSLEPAQNNDKMEEDKVIEQIDNTIKLKNNSNNSKINNKLEENNMSDTTENTTPVESTSEVTNQTFVAPTEQFSAKEFAEANKLPYPNALAYLKLNAKEVGKRSNGRGRPTILYSLV